MTHPALHCTFSSNAIFTLFTLSYISQIVLTLLLQWNTKGDVLNNATSQKKVLQVWDIMTERKFLDLFLCSANTECIIMRCQHHPPFQQHLLLFVHLFLAKSFWMCVWMRLSVAESVMCNHKKEFFWAACCVLDTALHNGLLVSPS